MPCLAPNRGMLGGQDALFHDSWEHGSIVVACAACVRDRAQDVLLRALNSCLHVVQTLWSPTRELRCFALLNFSLVCDGLWMEGGGGGEGDRENQGFDWHAVILD